MELFLRPLDRADLPEATRIWNEIIEAGDSFPDDTPYSEEDAWAMFSRQTVSVCAVHQNKIAGVYILHPNNFGRCRHIANASYAVDSRLRGQGIGRALVLDCLERARQHGFTGLQFNAVVASNTAAVALYLRLGFSIVGTIKNGYRFRNEGFRDTLVFLKSW